MILRLLHQALLTTNIQALVLRIRKECSCRKMAAGDTTVGSTPKSREREIPGGHQVQDSRLALG